MKDEPRNSDNARYQVFRSKHVVFVVKHENDDSFFIALSANTTDAEAVQMASESPDRDWRKIDTIIFRAD